MHDLLHVALGKLLKDTPDVPVGVVEVDETVTLHVKATIRRNQDGEYTPTVSIPLKATLALLLAKMGFQRERAAELLVDAMTEALNEGLLGEETVTARLADVDAAMARVQAITAALPKETRKGAVTVKGSVEVIEPEPAAVLVDAAELF